MPRLLACVLSGLLIGVLTLRVEALNTTDGLEIPDDITKGWGLLVRMEKTGLSFDKVLDYQDNNSTRYKEISIQGLIKLSNYMNKDAQRRMITTFEAEFAGITKLDYRTIRADYLAPCNSKFDPVSFMHAINMTIQLHGYSTLTVVDEMHITVKKVPLLEENRVTRLTVTITGENYNATLKNSSSKAYIEFKNNFESKMTASLEEHNIDPVSVQLLELRSGSLIADADIFTSNTTSHDDVKKAIGGIMAQTGEDIIDFENPIVKAETFIASGHEAVEPPSNKGKNVENVDIGTIAGFNNQDMNLHIPTKDWGSVYLWRVTLPSFCVFFFISVLVICCCRATPTYKRQKDYIA